MSQTLKPGIDFIGVGVGAVIFNDRGEMLLMKRGPLAKNERGSWEIPGGAIEFGETLEEGLIREVREELGVEIQVIRFINAWNHILPEDKQHWVSPTYICKIVSGEPVINEPGKTDEIGWFSLEKAQTLQLAKVTQQDVNLFPQKPELIQNL